MDIVDINKVLDDLELNEGQHSELKRSQENEHIHNNVNTNTQEPVDNLTMDTGILSQTSVSNRPSKKSVNVSNVFNSLNEYVNAEIETTKLLSYTSPALLTTTCTKNSTSISEKMTSEETNQVEHAENSQQQYYQEYRKQENHQESPQLSAESVNAIEFKSNQSTFKFDEKFSEKSKNETSTILEENPSNCIKEYSDNNQQLKYSITSREMNKTEPTNPNRLQNEPYSEIEIEDIDRNPEIPNRMPRNIEDESFNNNVGAASKSLTCNRFIRPISFETAATMDDVSDTELESYLQELEDLNGSTACDSNGFKSENNLENPTANESKTSEIATDDSFNDSKQSTLIPKNENGSGFDSNIRKTSTVQTNTGDNNENSLTLNQNSNTFEEDHIPKMANGSATNNETGSQDVSELTESTETDSITNQSNTFPTKRPNTLNLQSVVNLSNYESISISRQLSSSSLSLSSDSNMSSRLTPIADSSVIPTADNFNENVTYDPSSCDALKSQSQSMIAQSISASHLINSSNISVENIGKVQPYWIPDSMTMSCMQCNQKFSFIKRRHHCRACGLVLCSACCSLKSKLEYLGGDEARICIQCDILLNMNRDTNRNTGNLIEHRSGISYRGQDTASGLGSNDNEDISSTVRSPNPNNPMEYCSIIPPYQQVASSSTTPTPISVMVPVGVLKRDGVSSKTQRKEKNVMFSDGIRPGCELTDLDNDWDAQSNKENAQSSTGSDYERIKIKINNIKLPIIDPKTNSYIPSSIGGRIRDNSFDHNLPPICISTKTEFKYAEVTNNEQLIERLKNEQLKFIILRNFYVLVKIVKLTCCINKMVINFTTQGMHLVGQDEIIILLELDNSNQIPKDIFLHLNNIYQDADKGQAITELGFSMANTSQFLGSKEHGGFLFIRTTFQCMQNVIIPESPYLIGILIHRWEVPWAKVFPLRLMLRLGALHRYYPSPHVSVRYRNSVYAEIAQTIINFLADFRTYSYTLPTIRGMYIHMEERRTNVLIPKNRYDQVMKALNNSSDHIIALAGNFSKLADGHLVCVQNTESGCTETHAYSTQAINIQGKPRKVTGASFFVLNGALKTTSGLSGKCSIVEDGLMVQILSKKMVAIQHALKTMKDIDIVCGPIDGDESQTELVCIQWVENDKDYNIGVVSPIDNQPMDGVPSIRVHHGMDFAHANHTIRWTEVFILKGDDESAHGKDPIDMSKISECIARSASIALVSFLDLLAASGLKKLAIRVTLDQDQVCYEAGSNNIKLAPLYMNALDSELVPTLHKQATNLHLDQTICLELIFHILEV